MGNTEKTMPNTPAEALTSTEIRQRIQTNADEAVKPTPANKRKYTKHSPEELNVKRALAELKAQNSLLENKVKELEVSCTKFKEQYSCADQAYQHLKGVAKDRETYLKHLLRASYESAARMEDMRA